MCFSIYSPSYSNVKSIFSMESMHSNKGGNQLCYEDSCIPNMQKQSCGGTVEFNGQHSVYQ